MTIPATKDAPTGLVTRSLDVQIKAIRADDRECDFVASTEVVDRYSEVVEQDWDLTAYKTNPVVLYSHDMWDLPIGQCTRVEVKSGQLECTIKFASAEANPKAEQVWKLIQEKVLRAVSVGFRHKDYRYEKRDGKDVYVLSGNTLYEISVTPIGVNQEALAKSKALAKERAAREGTTKGGADAASKETVMEIEKQLAQANEKALTSEKALAVAETKLTEAQKALDAAKAEAAEAKLDVAAQKKALESVTAERDKACGELGEAKKAITTAKVDALVGKKFAPAERDVMVELALSNEKLFEKTIAARPDMVHTGRVVPKNDKGAPSTNASGAGDNGDALAALIDAGDVDVDD